MIVKFLEKEPNSLFLLENFYLNNASSQNKNLPISTTTTSKTLDALQSISHVIYRKDYLEEQSRISSFFNVVCKGIGCMITGLLGLHTTGVKIGITEKETVLESGLKGFPGLYGYFKVVIDRHQNRISIDKIHFLTLDFKNLILQLMKRTVTKSMNTVIWSFILGISAGFLILNMRNSARVWKKSFRKIFIKKKDTFHRKIINQNHIYCEECNKVPADIMFEKCKHMTHCRDCFQSKFKDQIDIDQKKCDGIKCSNCSIPVWSYIKIVYN